MWDVHPDESTAYPFNQKEVEMLFKDVLTRIDSITDERFKVTDEYRVDLTTHIECPIKSLLNPDESQ